MKHTRTFDYYLPQFSDKKYPYVYFSCRIPNTDKMKRFVTRLGRIKNKRQRKTEANKMIRDISDKLESGWTPWDDDAAPKGFRRFSVAMDAFIKSKSKELKKSSMHHYPCMQKALLEYLERAKKEDIYVTEFTEYMAVDFMSKLWAKENISAKTYNNYLQRGRAIFNWMMEEKYVRLNPFKAIKRKKEKWQTKRHFSEKHTHEIFAYLKQYNKPLCTVSKLLYYCYIRPTETGRLLVSDFDLENQTINVRPETSKNGRPAVVTIPNSFVNDLREHFAGAKPTDFAFAHPQTFEPGEIEIENADRKYRYVWRKVRDELDLPKDYHFYALKHTGMAYAKKMGMTDDQIMRQARHQDLKVTSKYLWHVEAKGDTDYKENFPDM